MYIYKFSSYKAMHGIDYGATIDEFPDLTT